MTYESDTLANNNFRLVFVVEIAGVAEVFVSSSVPAALVSNRSQKRWLLAESISLGAEQLDLGARCVTGGGLSFSMADIADGELAANYTVSPSLIQLITPRRRTGAYLAANIAITGAVTTITVNSTTGFESAGVVHIGGEAFSYTGTTGTTFTGCTRAVYGTRAQSHYGGSDAMSGALVTDAPQGWTGRRVTLKIGYATEDGAMGSLETMGVFRVRDVPSFSYPDTWSFECDPLADFFREQRCYVGLVDVASAELDAGLGNGSFTVQEYDQNQTFRVREAPSHVLIETTSRDIYQLRRLEGVSGAIIEVSSPDLLTPTAVELWEGTGNEDWAQRLAVRFKHVAFLRGAPAGIVVALLTSVTGGGANGSSDLLPGRVRTAFGQAEWRMGAGILAADVNTDDVSAGNAVGSFWHMLDCPVPWAHLLASEISVGELLHEFCQTVGAYWYVDGAGRISVERYRDTAPPSMTIQTLVIDDDEIEPGSDTVKATESRIATAYRLECNYEPLPDEHAVTMTVIDWENRDRFPEADKTFQFTSRFVHLNTTGLMRGGSSQRLRVASPTIPETLISVLRRSQLLNALGDVDINVTTGWRGSVLRVGNFVDVARPSAPDHEGDRLTSSRAIVVGREVRPADGTVTLRLRQVARGRCIAPVGVVSSVSTTTFANDTWTLSTTQDHKDPSLTSPVDAFAVGWVVKAYDVSAGTFYNITVAAVTPGSHQIRFTASPGFTPVAGDYFFPVRDEALPAAVSGYDEDDFAWQTDVFGANESTRWS